ncbi:MAG: thrombospondin type 3 repeat-containing protein, partial [Acidobacteriota bacterium]
MRRSTRRCRAWVVGLACVAWMSWGAGIPVRAQGPGEIVEAAVLDVPSDLFGCRHGQQPCGLSYRIYHVVPVVEINMPPSVLDGHPRFRPKRGMYQTDATQTGNFPATRGQVGMAFFVAWDGVLQPDTAAHVGYYGVQSQIITHGENGDSTMVNCHRGNRQEACFEPLSGFTSGQVLRTGAGPIGGLAPIPVPSIVQEDADRIVVEWDQARGYVVTDGAPVGLVGYQLYAYPGAGPTDGALSGGARLVQEMDISSTRAEIPLTHPALAGASRATFVLKMTYAGNLTSLYFSANSESVTLDENPDDDETRDGDEDGVVDAEDNCPEQFNADQSDLDGDGQGDACDPTPDGEDDREEADDAGTEESGESGTGIDETGAGVETPARPSDGSAPGPSTPVLAPVPAAPSASLDDGDGIGPDTDNCPGLFNPGQEDRDADGQGDACDGDGDGDGVGDDRDCAPGNALAGVAIPAGPAPTLEVSGIMASHIDWLPADARRFELLRGRLPLVPGRGYDHACLLGGLTAGEAHDSEPLPGAGSGFYYLLAADTGCGQAAPGTDSRGWLRPPGPGCVEARTVRTLLPGDEASSDPWSLAAHGGPGTEVELSVV